MSLPFKEVLILAPHTDDGELGAGGTIARLRRNNARVSYVAFSAAELSVPAGLPQDILRTEVKTATQTLGLDPDDVFVHSYEVRKLGYARQAILEDLVELRNNRNYDLVIVPSLKDIHQDHQTIALEGLRAFKNTTIFGYELVWNNLSFDATCFVRLDEEDLDRKIDALGAYASQSSRSYLSPDFIRSLARVRGVQIGVEYAESFEVIRWVIN